MRERWNERKREMGETEIATERKGEGERDSGL